MRIHTSKLVHIHTQVVQRNREMIGKVVTCLFATAAISMSLVAVLIYINIHVEQVHTHTYTYTYTLV